MEVWTKWYCIEQFQFKLCEQIYQIIAKNWLNCLVHFDSVIGENGCISWAKALHFKPVSGTLYKLTEKVLNCCIWSQKVLVLVLLKHPVVCAETLKMLIFDAIIFGGSFYKI